MDRTAYLSVHDKTGAADFAAGLEELGFAIYASGSTWKALREAGVEAEEVRYSPPVPCALLKALSGRFPAVSENGVELPRFFLAAADLFPLAEITGREDFTDDELPEYLDQANSAVLRAAARDFNSCAAICSPADYAPVLAALRDSGGLEPGFRRELASKAWQYLAAYEATVAQYLSGGPAPLGDSVVLSLKKAAALEYGENRHQRAAFYELSGARPRGLNRARLLQGRAFNLNHYLDLDSSYELALQFPGPAAVIAKHARPAAACEGPRLRDCLASALAADPQGAVGGTAAFNRQVDAETAGALRDSFVESVIAPGYSAEALAALKAAPRLRVLELPQPVLSPREISVFSVSGGLLVEEKDGPALPGEPSCVTRRRPSESESRSLALACRVACAAKTYSAVLARGTCTAAVVSGESSTLEAVRSALRKVKDSKRLAKGDEPLVLGANAALPLATLKAALEGGISAVIQPGGWDEDFACGELCDSKGAAMLLTGSRHLKH